MPYNRIERYVATLLDSTPGLRRLAKASYQRVNYLLHGRPVESMRLHPKATIERPPGVRRATEVRDHSRRVFLRILWAVSLEPRWQMLLFHQWHQQRRSVDILPVRPSRRWSPECLPERSPGIFSREAWRSGWPTTAVVGNCLQRLRGRKLVSRIVTLDGRERKLEWPIQAVHPGAEHALSLNYRRLARIQPEYGYDADVDNFTPDQPLNRDGIWRLDLRSADAQLIVSLEELAGFAPRPDALEADHKVNHACTRRRRTVCVYAPLAWLAREVFAAVLRPIRRDRPAPAARSSHGVALCMAR